MTYSTITKSPGDTLKIATKLAALLNPGNSVELQGDLGSGKTYFTKGLARGLGYKGEVTSPTFTISQIYLLPTNRRLYHFDFYRLGDDALIAGELSEALADPNGIVVTEWGQGLAKLLPQGHIVVHLETIAENKRRITIVGIPKALEDVA